MFITKTAIQTTTNDLTWQLLHEQLTGGEMARGKKNWIQKAIKKPGSLRRAAGVKKGQKISGKELTKLSKSKNPTTRKRANLAKTLKGFKK